MTFTEEIQAKICRQADERGLLGTFTKMLDEDIVISAIQEKLGIKKQKHDSIFFYFQKLNIQSLMARKDPSIVLGRSASQTHDT